MSPSLEDGEPRVPVTEGIKEKEMADVQLEERGRDEEEGAEKTDKQRESTVVSTASIKMESPKAGYKVSPEKNPTFLPHALPANKPRMNGTNIRYTILIGTIVVLSSLMANIVCFNFTILCMPGTNEATNANHTYVGYTKDERTWLFSAVAMGAMAAVVPVSLATHSVGTRAVFFTTALISSFSTLLIPFASRISFPFFVALRFLQGVGFAAAMPTVGAVTSNWAALAQNGLFMSVLTTFGQLSAVFSMPVSGELCISSLGWTAVYYLHGAISLVVCTVWFALYRNEPADHPLVSKRELAEIQSGKAHHATEKNEETKTEIPYVQIMSTPSIWGIWIGALGDLIAVQLVHIFSPLFFREVLNYSVEETGWTSALPVLFQFFVKIFAGHSSDNIRGISETTKLRIYNSIALGASAIFMIALAYLPKGYSATGVILMTLTTAMFGFNGGGFNKCAALVSRQYSHFVMANIQFLWCLSMLICPILVNFILRTGSLSEWRLVFVLHAILLLVSNGLFCLLATAKPAKWTDPSITKASRRNTPMVTLNNGKNAV